MRRRQIFPPDKQHARTDRQAAGSKKDPAYMARAIATQLFLAEGGSRQSLDEKKL